jgi:hypothetical protein
VKPNFGRKLGAITFHSSPEVSDQIDQAKIESPYASCGGERKMLLLR